MRSHSYLCDIHQGHMGTSSGPQHWLKACSALVDAEKDAAEATAAEAEANEAWANSEAVSGHDWRQFSGRYCVTDDVISTHDTEAEAKNQGKPTVTNWKPYEMHFVLGRGLKIFKKNLKTKLMF